MKTSFLMIPAVIVVSGMFACGDSGGAGGSTGTTTGTGTTTATTGSSTTTGASTSTGGSCGVPGDMTDTCEHACATLYDCGALTCGGMKNCPGFSGMSAEKTAFIGDASGGCVKTCMGNAALKAVVDPTDCKSTVSIIEGADTTGQFKMVCMNGFGTSTSSSSSSGSGSSSSSSSSSSTGGG